MKRFAGALVLVLALSVSAAAAPAASTAYKAGDRVMVNWTGDNYWYPATIVTISGGKYYVIYCDTDRETVTADRIAPLDVQVGDVLECNWQNGGVYYEGKVTVKSGDMIHISYNDGDQEDTTIEYIRVLQP